MSEVKYCDFHEISLESLIEKPRTLPCPYCERDKLYDEIEFIKETFEAAISSKEKKGGQQVPYHGDFASAPPSVINQMRWWVNRWKAILPKEFEP